MKTKWIFRLLAALLSLCGLTACVTDGVPYYGGGNLGGGAWQGGGWNNGWNGGGWNGGGWGSGWNNGWVGGRACCPRCGFNPCRCGTARWNHDRDHDHDRDRRSSGSGTLYRIKDPEKGEPRGYYSKDWFEQRGYQFSRNTWETKGGNTVRGSEVPKIVREERKDSSSRSRSSSSSRSSSERGSSNKSSSSSRGSSGSSNRGSSSRNKKD